MRRLLILLLATGLLLLPPVPSHAAGMPSPARAPLPGSVVRGFDAPEPDWLPGHRGVDLAGWPGDTVRAAAAGTVSFAGELAGRGVVTVTHGGVRTTYEPVTPLVEVGQAVALGEPIGVLVAGHPGCLRPACLHWGLKRGETYLDPRLLLGPRRVRLVPTSGLRPGLTGDGAATAPGRARSAHSPG